VDWVRANLLPRLGVLLGGDAGTNPPMIVVDVGSRSAAVDAPVTNHNVSDEFRRPGRVLVGSRLQENFTFDAFVEGLQPPCSYVVALAWARRI
jgi:hypothetical protein